MTTTSGEGVRRHNEPSKDKFASKYFIYLLINQFHKIIFSFILTEVYSIIRTACCFFETSDSVVLKNSFIKIFNRGRQLVFTDSKTLLN